mgnify:CR=1 FL=1|tara:strand:- start:5341 stop:5703 length:363 start_codon:yes stop_codon:yes gene_type:complete
MPGPKSDKIWSAAIHKAVHEYEEVENEDGSKEKRRKINLLATNFVAMAIRGDVQAIKEIGDRLDGKPHQSVGVSNDDKTPQELTDDAIDARIVALLGRIEGTTSRKAPKKNGKDELPSVH